MFDLDGVLADVQHRLHLLAGVPKDWDAFFAAAVDDPLLDEGAQLVRELASTDEIHYLTGRPESSRELTERWLRRHRLPAGAVVMRPDGDHRPARLFKLEQLRLLQRGRTISCVVDDDPEVVALLRDNDLPVRQADWLPYAAPLKAAQESDGRT